MPTYRYPTLAWEDHAGLHTAYLIRDWKGVVAVGRSEAEALRQVRELMSYLDRQTDVELYEPELEEPRLTRFKVEVRCEYQGEDERIFPCAEPVALHVACVHGKSSRGLRLAVLPRLDVRFYYHEEGGLKDLVTHYVRQRLEGKTPRQVSRFLPPRRVTLTDVPVRVSRRVRARPAFETTALEGVAEPLGGRALQKKFGRPWERDAELSDLEQRLADERASLLLVGEPGVGKTTLLVEAVRHLERKKQDGSGEQPSLSTGAPRQNRFWLTSGGRLISGMRYLGQWEERLEQVLAELSRIDGVLCVENLLELVNAGGRTPGDGVAAFLIPYLESRELRLVSEATPAELEAIRRLLPGLVELLQIQRVPTFNRARSVRVLERLGASLTQRMSIELEREAVGLVYRLFARFAPYGAFPGKATAFLRDLFEVAGDERRGRVRVADVMQAFVRRTGLPELFLRDDVLLDAAAVLETFQSQVMGQEAGCRTALDLVTTFKAGLNDPGRPVGVYLFCGPTGVGKTALARALARFFFGHGEAAPDGREDERLVRLDMSEYSGPLAGERLLSTPDGGPSELIRRLREQPFVVLLLDEIEKASREVFDVLMGVFDEGRLTDRFGRTTTFCSAVIVMTSNLGAGSEEALGFNPEVQPTYEGEAMTFFRPEFFNRMDGVVTFRPLAAETVREIAAKELRDLSGREGLARARLGITWSEALVDLLAARGFDRRYGARPLQRTLESLVVTPLARYLVERPALEGVTLALDVVDGALTIEAL